MPWLPNWSGAQPTYHIGQKPCGPVGPTVGKMQPMWTRIAAARKCLTLLITFASVFVWFSDEGCTEQPLKAAVFGLELLNTSEEGTITGERSDQTQRVALANAELRRLLDASGQIIGVDLTPQITEIARSTPLFSCKGCEQKIARSLGADVTTPGNLGTGHHPTEAAQYLLRREWLLAGEFHFFIRWLPDRSAKGGSRWEGLAAARV
jgi:hypothetical protein